jgi:hypothetical protein
MAFWPLVFVYGALQDWLVTRRLNAGARARIAEVPAS